MRTPVVLLVEQAAQRVRMLRVGLEQCITGAAAAEGAAVAHRAERTRWRLQLSRREMRSLRCRVSLYNLLYAYNIIRKLMKLINEIFSVLMIQEIVTLLIRCVGTTYFLKIYVSKEIDILILFMLFINIFTSLAILFLTCVACERLALQRMRLLSLLIDITIDSDFLHPRRSRRARNIARAMLSEPLTISLWAGCELRAAFIPVLLSLLTDCFLLRLQLP